MPFPGLLPGLALAWRAVKVAGQGMDCLGRIPGRG